MKAGPSTGKIAVVRPDGSPMVAPIWFDVDRDGSLVFTAGHESTNARATRREPRVSICVDNEEPPFDDVRIEGTAELIDDFDVLRQWATRLGGRYTVQDRAEEFGRRNAVASERVVRVTPVRVVGLAEIAGQCNR